MGDTGLEHFADGSHASNSNGNDLRESATEAANQSGAQSGALCGDSGVLDADLAAVVEAWPELTAKERAAILAIVERAS